MRKWIVVLGAVGAVALGGGALALDGGDGDSAHAGRRTTTTTLGVEPPSEPTAVHVFAEGECFFELDVVPCSEAHTQENFAGFRITGTSRLG